MYTKEDILKIITDSYVSSYHKGFYRFSTYVRMKCHGSLYIISMITGQSGNSSHYEKLSDRDKEKIDEFIDYALSEDTYDVIFQCCLCDDMKGFALDYQECLDWIKQYNGTDHSYFADYRKGESTVGIYSNLLDMVVYETKIK